MTLDKKILLWTMAFRSVGALAAISVIEQSQLWTAIFGVLTVICSEMKDFYLKKQDAKL